MEMNKYLELSARTCAEFPDGLHLSQFQVDLLHAAMGMQTEAAEFTDALKKHIFYGKPLNELNMKEELGDQMWYLALAIRKLQVTFELLAGMNIDKLAARYGDKFSSEKAINRDVENEVTVMKTSAIGPTEAAYRIGDTHPSTVDGPISVTSIEEARRTGQAVAKDYLGRSGMLPDDIPVTQEEDEAASPFAVPLDGRLVSEMGFGDEPWVHFCARDMLTDQQEPKYGGYLFKRVSGERLPNDEPLFVLRGQDLNAVQAIRFYAGLTSEPTHKRVVLQRVQDFIAFADAHPERMKKPDSPASMLRDAG